MNIKKRFSLIFSSLFSILLATVLISIYYLFLNFRRNEFRLRLTQRAETTVKFLVGVEGMNYQLLDLIDRNRVNKLYNEKTSVFNDELQRIYTSNTNYRFKWTKQEFEEIEQKKIIIKSKEDYEVIGLLYQFNNKKYFVLVSAEDEYENTKMNFLRYLLLAAFIFGTVAVWTLSFYLSKASLKPLDWVGSQIAEITDKNLNTRLPVSSREDEINALSNSFNQMMDRIDHAYQLQREFTGNASHELRMPIARITAQLENVIQKVGLNNGLKNSLRTISTDMYHLSDTITSLLLLSEIQNYDRAASFQKIRLDEVIFMINSSISSLYNDLRFNFNIENFTERELNLEIDGDERLLKIVFSNLIKNAYIYSDNKIVDCTICQTAFKVQIIISNTGDCPQVPDTALLFNTFVRGSNVKNIAGSGVGLSIAKRILEYHEASIEYYIPEENLNRVIINFPIQ